MTTWASIAFIYNTSRASWWPSVCLPICPGNEITYDCSSTSIGSYLPEASCIDTIVNIRFVLRSGRKEFVRVISHAAQVSSYKVRRVSANDQRVCIADPDSNKRLTKHLHPAPEDGDQSRNMSWTLHGPVHAIPAGCIIYAHPLKKPLAATVSMSLPTSGHCMHVSLHSARSAPVRRNRCNRRCDSQPSKQHFTDFRH